MSLSNVENALITAYQGAGLSLPTEYENQEFTRPSSGNYATVYFVPNQPEGGTLGDTGEDAIDGFFQIDIYVERFKGNSEIRAHLETLRSVFKAGARFTSNGQTVIINSCGRNQGRNIDGYYMATITIFWRAYLNR